MIDRYGKNGMPPSQPVTIVLADDHAIVREGFAALFSSQGFQVLGQCSDGIAAVQMVRDLKPDFAILDYHMPGMTGVESIRKLRETGTAAKLVILSVSSEQGSVVEALRAGADAYLLKDGPSRHLLDAVAFIHDGGIYLSPLLRGKGEFTKSPGSQPRDPLAKLSPRELEVFACLVNGLRAKEIADLLDISPKTVPTYRASLMRKLQVRDLVGLVKFAIERNLTTTSPPQA